MRRTVFGPSGSAGMTLDMDLGNTAKSSVYTPWEEIKAVAKPRFSFYGTHPSTPCLLSASTIIAFTILPHFLHLHLLLSLLGYCGGG